MACTVACSDRTAARSARSQTSGVTPLPASAAAASIRGLSEPTVKTVCPASRRARAAATPEGPLPPVTTTFRVRPALIRRSWQRVAVPAAPVSDVPVMPAVDSITGRIFFSSAS